jgi:hypothetical protein
MEITWSETNPANAAEATSGTRDTVRLILGGETVLASFVPQVISAEDRVTSGPSIDPPDRREAACASMRAAGGEPVEDEEQGARILSWVGQQWIAQLDEWRLFGEPVYWCEHADPEVDEDRIFGWFLRFPAAMACEECSDRIFQAMLSSDSPGRCDACGAEEERTVLHRIPGMTIVATCELCPICAGL